MDTAGQKALTHITAYKNPVMCIGGELPLLLKLYLHIICMNIAKEQLLSCISVSLIKCPIQMALGSTQVFPANPKVHHQK